MAGGPLEWMLVNRLRSKDHGVSTKAFEEAIHKRETGALLKIVEADDPYLRRSAIDALGAIADPAAVPALMGRLGDANFNNKEAAAAALAKIGDARAVKPLVTLLQSTHDIYQTRRAAADALIQIGDPRGALELLETLSGGDDDGRCLSLLVLGALGDQRAVPAAIAALRHPTSNVRWHAVRALGEVRDPRAVPPLLEELAEGGDRSAGYRADVAKALGRLGDMSVAPDLARLLDHREANLRKAAAEALAALGWRPQDPAARAGYEVAAERFDQLASSDWDQARAPLLKALRGADFLEARKLLVEIKRIGGRRAVAPLAEILALVEDDPGQEIANALADLGDARAVEPLMAFAARYRPQGGYRNDPRAPYGEKTRAAASVKPLARLVQTAAGAIDADLLRKLAALTDTTYDLEVEYNTPGYGDGSDAFSVAQSFADVRALAQAELRRRGLPE